MKVLITGAAGFIGSSLVDHYLDIGDDVIGVDNFATGSLSNLRNANSSDRFRLLDVDISEISAANLLQSLLPVSPDLILHFASPASPVDYANLPTETLFVNSIGTRLCLDLSRLTGARFLFASTSEAYGDPLEHPQRETYWGNVNSIGLRSCYDEGKRFGEALTMAYFRTHHIDARIIRIFNTYGPRMRLDDGRVVPNFVAQALRDEPLTLYGEGKQTRSFCYVSDLVAGIVACALTPAARGEVINLGNPDERTILEFAAAVCHEVGVPLKVVHKAMPADDPGRRCPDISRARALLNWEPIVTLEAGLTSTVEYFRTMADAKG